MSTPRSGTEESRERKIALFWTLVRAHENRTPMSQDEIVSHLMIDEFPVTTKVPKRKLAYEGNENAHRQKFERDKAAIRELGFEITTTKTESGADGYSIDPASVFIPALELTDDERNVAAWSTRLLGIGAAGVGRLFADGPRSPSGIEFSPILLPLTRAAATSRVVRFWYRKDNNDVRERVIAPLEFLYAGGQSYVIGVERRSVTVKGFKVSRIQGVPTVTSEQFIVDDGVRAVARQWVPRPGPSDDALEATFATSADYARTLSATRAGGEVPSDGTVTVSVRYPSLASARRALLAHGDHVWSARPRALREELVRWLKDVNRPGTLKATPVFSTVGSRSDTLGQTLQLIATVYQSDEPLHASELAARSGLDTELVRSIMSRVMALQYVRDPTQYLVHIEPGEELDDLEEPADPRYARSASYDEAIGASLAPLTWRDAFELLVALKEASALYPSELNDRVIAKVERAVSANVRVLEYEPEYLAAVRDAIAEHQQLKINYWSATSDQVTERWVEPRAIGSRNGRWYFRAWCNTRMEWLTFRVDRIVYVHAAGPTVVTRPTDANEQWLDQLAEEGYVVTVVLQPEQRWLFEPLPTIEWATLDGDEEVVRFRVRDDRFLDQLLVEAGPGCYVLDPPGHRAGRALAQRMIDQL